jgi:hypothetical protein
MRSKSRPSAPAIERPERGLADAGRADEEQDRAARVGLQAPDGEELEDAVLDALEAVVVGVEDLAAWRGRGCPRSSCPTAASDPLEPPADDAVLGGGLRQALQARELAVGLRADRFGQRDSASCSRSSSTSASAGSRSPSSSWIARSCWRRTNSRCERSISPCTSVWMRVPIWMTSSSRARISAMRRSRARRRLLEQRLLLLGLQPQRAGDEVRQRAGSSMLATATCSSSGRYGSASTICRTSSARCARAR